MHFLKGSEQPFFSTIKQVVDYFKCDCSI